MRRIVTAILFCAAALSIGGGCSVRQYAVDSIGDTLATGDSVFTDDDDIELIGEALPFSLKFVESLLANSPEHRGLLLTAARGYLLYAYGYVQYSAEQMANEGIEGAGHLRRRARKLYLRSYGYAMRGLETSYPGIGDAIMLKPVETLARIDDGAAAEVPFLYFAASAVGLGISVSKDDAAMLARLSEVEALLDRALELDEAYDDGALHEFAVVWAGAAPGRRDRAAVEGHYQRALALSRGHRASLYVAYAMAAALPDQDRERFRSLMETALSVDIDAIPGKRLLTVIAHRRARDMLARLDELFLE